MAMVGNHSNQPGPRNWNNAPSSSPAGSDEALSHPNPAQANLHGVIGEHRRSSRSSSVSSGGSSGNNTDSHDPSRSLQHSRLQQASSQPDQSSLHVLSHIEDTSGKEQAVAFSNSGIQVLNGSHPSSSSPSTELVSQIGVMSNGADQMSMGGYGLPPRAMVSSPGFSPQPNMTQRQGRPITGTYTASQGIGNDADYTRMITEGSMTPSFPSTGQMNYGGPHHDVFSMASMEASLANSQTSPNSMVSAGAGTFPSPKSFPGNGSQMSYNSGQYYYSQTGNSNNFNTSPQNVSSNYYSSVKQPSMSASNGQTQQHPGYTSSSGSGYYQNTNLSGAPNGRQNGGSSYLYNTQQQQQQDFTIPPPWQGQGFGLSGEVINKVTCDSCHQLYKWPHALDCLHVNCFTCLVKKFDANNQIIICTKCNFVTPAPKGVCGLRLDYQICNFMLKHSLQPFTCTLCTRDEPAAWCCQMCSAFLCNECCERHKDMLHFHNHEVKSITKAAIHNGEVKPMCEYHPDMTENKYCVVCESMICDNCIPEHTHPGTPNSNQNYDLQEAYNIVAPRLQTWNEDAFIKYQDVTDISKRFPDLHSIMDMRKRHSKRMVEDYADYIKTVVDQSRAAAVDQLEQAHAQMESKVNAMIKQYSDLCTGSEGMHAFNRRTLDEGSVFDVMKNLDKMENRYKMIIGLHSEVLKCPDGINVDFKFNPNYPSTNELIHENFQMLTYKVNDVEYTISPAPSPNKLDPKGGRKFMEYSTGGSSENSDCNYQRWSSATESVSISTWNSGTERDRKNGTFIPNINRCRTRTSYTHVFGEYGRGDYAFTEPSGQAYLKDGSYVICDTNNHRIVYYSANHEFIRSIGMPDNLPPLEDQDQRGNGLRNKGFTRQENCLYFPNRVAICPITQNIVATERPPSHDIQIFTKEGEFKKCFGGNILQHPRGVTVDENGVIIVVECKVMKLVMFDQEGNFIVSHSLTKDLEFPNDVAAKADRIYISDNRGHCVQVYNYDAEFIQKIGFESVTYFPIGVSINFQNQLVVTDNHNTFNITVFDLSGKVLHIFESITKHAQCHNVAVHPSSLELMLTTKDCNVYFFNYDPNAQHPPPAAATRHSGHPFNSRRSRGNSNGGNGGYF